MSYKCEPIRGDIRVRINNCWSWREVHIEQPKSKYSLDLELSSTHIFRCSWQAAQRSSTHLLLLPVSIVMLPLLILQEQEWVCVWATRKRLLLGLIILDRGRAGLWQMAELVKFKCAPLLTYILLSIYQIPLIYLDDHNPYWKDNASLTPS